MFSDSVISRILNAGDNAASAPAREVSGSASQPVSPPEAQRDLATPTPVAQAVRASIETSPMTPPAPAPEQPQLFSRAAPAGFVVAPQPAQGAAPPSQPAVLGGGPALAPVGATGEAIEVASGLQPSLPYVLPNGAGYRGPALRAGQMQAAAHGMMDVGQPVPPALAQQVQAMVYGAPGAADPLLTWSSSSRGQVVASGVPVPAAGDAVHAGVGGGGTYAPSAMAAQTPAGMPPARVVSPAAVRSVPMQPPPGAYPGAGVAGAPIAQPPTDPFLARAEGHAGVSFG